MSERQRIHNLEEAFMLFCAILTGEPADATSEEKIAAQVRYAELMDEIRSLHA